MRKKQKSGSGRIIKVLLFFFFLPLVAGAFIGGYRALQISVPSVRELREYKSIPGAKIYADDDVLIAELRRSEGIFVPVEEMPADLINAVVAVEDSNFWTHKGIDYLAILRAAVKDLAAGHLKEGGSTITQQLAKVTFLSPEKTLQRKLKEVILATRIEKDLSKSEILELYLNKVYFGHGAYGAEMASRLYFGHPASRLSLPEAALLAGLLKAPSKYSPYKDINRAVERQRIVLARMQEAGFISEEKLNEALKTPLRLSRTSIGEANNYFIDYVREYLLDKYGEEALYGGGMSVHTTLDRHAQIEAKRALQEGLRALDKRRGFRGPIGRREDISGFGGPVAPPNIMPSAGDIAEGVVLYVKEHEAAVKTSGMTGTLALGDALWASRVIDPKTQKAKTVEKFALSKLLRPGDVIKVRVKSVDRGRPQLALEQDPEVQGAVISVDPRSGYVRALVGGYDYSKSEFNRALYAERQPGSGFKPLIYSIALDGGFTPASIIVDEEVKYVNGPGDVWMPKNFDGEYHGPTRLREALTYSRNVVTVKLVEKLGVEKVIEGARALGIESPMPRDLTIGLGSLSIRPLELTMAYAVFANGGTKVKPVFIKYATDRKGRVVESNEPAEERVIEPQTAFLITSMMKDVITYGTGQRVKALGRPAAGKTGTTNDYKDAWFIGFTTELLATVWVGFDDNRPLGSEETGARAAAPVWLDFMQAVSEGEPTDFQMPEGIVEKLIDPDTGLLAGEWTKAPLVEYFKAGTEPKERSPSVWKVKEPDNVLF